MNKKYLSLLVLSLLSALVFTSCKKSSSPSTNNNNNNTTNNNNQTNVNGTLLTKDIQLDTLNAVGQDTLYKDEYQYDASKRLISATQFQYDGTTGSLTGEPYEKFSYNGTDTKPYKSVSSSLFGGGDSTVELYTFDNVGNVNKIKEVNYPTSGNDSTVVLFVNTATIFKIANSYTSGTIIGRDTTYFQSSLSGANVATASFNDEFQYSYATITYDSHKNPFAPLVLVANLRSGPIAEDGYYGGGFAVSANNVTGYSATYADQFTSPVTYPYSAFSFVYNSGDYPSSCRFISYDDVDINVKAAGVKYFFYSN